MTTIIRCRCTRRVVATDSGGVLVDLQVITFHFDRREIDMGGGW